jgi:hypothetical protein
VPEFVFDQLRRDGDRATDALAETLEQIRDNIEGWGIQGGECAEGSPAELLIVSQHVDMDAAGEVERPPPIACDLFQEGQPAQLTLCGRSADRGLVGSCRLQVLA